MAFKYLLNTALPGSAWLASVHSSTGVCVVEHGRLVEVREGFFVEGVWPGPFQDGHFDRYETFFGSGAIERAGGEFVFVPSSASVDYLYYRVTPGRTLCSNSLPYLLAASNDELDEFDARYARINASIMKGIDGYEQRIPTRHGSVNRLIYYNLVIKVGGMEQAAKPPAPVFNTFEQYRTYFSDVLAGIIQNARADGRKNRLKVLSTQSTGYDSTAINSVSSSAIDLTLCIGEPKERQNYFKKEREANRPNDSGEEICRHLGLTMHSIDRRYFLRDPSAEEIYWAGLNCCEDMNLHEVSRYVENGALLFTGSSGDVVWSNAASLSPDYATNIKGQLERSDLSCHGLSEARLHLGYVHAPAPYIGARNRKSIFDLSNSESMRPWSVGGSYDRPIPRRLAEEAGIPRTLFGQVKLATVVEILPPYLPHGERLRDEFAKYIREKRGRMTLLRMLILPRLNSAISRLQWKFGRLPWLGSLIDRIPTLGRRFNAVLYAYCVNRVVRSYARNTRLSPEPP